MSARDALQSAQFRVDHDYENGRGRAAAYSGSGANQQWLGTMHYRTEEIGNKPAVTVDNIQVDPAHRRQGVAAHLYSEVHAKRQLPFVHVGEEMSPLGRKTVRALAKKDPENHRMLAFTRNGNQTTRKIR